MASREERVAKNETNAREINEQIDEAHDESPPSRHVRMICECGHASCERVIAMTLAEYAELRSNPFRFAVLRDHVIWDLERILLETDRFVVVAKQEGVPADIAIEDDPRDQHP